MMAALYPAPRDVDDVLEPAGLAASPAGARRSCRVASGSACASPSPW